MVQCRIYYHQTNNKHGNIWTIMKDELTATVWRIKQDKTHRVHQSTVPSAMNVRTHKANNYAGLQHTNRVCWQRGELARMVNISDTMLDMAVSKIPIFHLSDFTILNTFLFLNSCGTPTTHRIPHCPPTELNWKCYKSTSPTWAPWQSHFDNQVLSLR